MIRPEHFFECGFKHLVALRTDVFYMVKVVPADQYAPGNSHERPDDEWPPNTFDNPENDGKPLKRRDRDSGQKHHPAHFFQIFLSFHNYGYVTDGFERECLLAF